jgi:hypothetical protein
VCERKREYGEEDMECRKRSAGQRRRRRGAADEGEGEGKGVRHHHECTCKNRRIYHTRIEGVGFS